MLPRDENWTVAAVVVVVAVGVVVRLGHCSHPAQTEKKAAAAVVVFVIDFVFVFAFVLVLVCFVVAQKLVVGFVVVRTQAGVVWVK